MKRTVFLALVLLGLSACKPLPKDQAHFEKGFKAYESGDFYTALLYLKPLVEEGHTAAQLLMAKMYANGQGVQTDAGKAELLRNLAAVKIYGKHPPPGTVQSSNATLKTLQDRLDYYEDGGTPGKAPPVQDISQLLTSLDLNAIKQMAKSDTENDVTPAEPAPVPQEETPAASPAPAPEPAAEDIDAARLRRSDHISLGIIRQSANNNDPLAMQLLSTGYAKGYYGLPVDPKQAALWRQKAMEARHSSGSASSEDEETEESLPMRELAIVVTGGLLLVGGGLWLRVRRKKR